MLLRAESPVPTGHKCRLTLESVPTEIWGPPASCLSFQSGGPCPGGPALAAPHRPPHLLHWVTSSSARKSPETGAASPPAHVPSSGSGALCSPGEHCPPRLRAEAQPGPALPAQSGGDWGGLELALLETLLGEWLGGAGTWLGGQDLCELPPAVRYQPCWDECKDPALGLKFSVSLYGSQIGNKTHLDCGRHCPSEGPHPGCSFLWARTWLGPT